MQVPFHPLIVHFPIALTFILPILIFIFAYLIKGNKMTPQGWLIIIGLQFVVTVSGYIALETGETGEDLIEKVVPENFIHAHEEAAEIFVGSTVLALVLSVAAFFIRREFQFKLHLMIAAVTLVSCYLASRAGILGGELVYKHGAASAYVNGDHKADNLLPAHPEAPHTINESLKMDENDYGNSDEDLKADDDDLKQED